MNQSINNLEFVNCLICDSDNAETLFEVVVNNSFMSIVKCNCSFVYLNPRPTIKDIGVYYDKSYSPHNFITQSIFFKILQNISFYWKRYIISKYCSISKKLLDIGGGDGSFSDYLCKNGWLSSVYDKFSNLDYVDNFHSKYSVITMWHSLEHIHNTGEIFKKIGNTLEDDGFLFIAVPNHDSIDRRFFKRKWIAYDIPRHLYHFTPTTIEVFLKQNRYKIISSYSMYQDTVFNVFNSFSSKLLKFILSPIIIPLMFCIIFLNNKYASSILYVCQKK